PIYGPSAGKARVQNAHRGRRTEAFGWKYTDDNRQQCYSSQHDIASLVFPMITILPVLRSARLTQSPNSKCITKLTEEFVYRQLKRRRFTGGDAANLAPTSRYRECSDSP